MGKSSRKKLVVGILAHVDAGKTTLSESLLYLSGKIRKLGRVDHRDTYLDTNPIERERGITVFSKQARFTAAGMDVVLLDTPGHVDFSAETERTLQVLDYAILVINGTDGVQNHTLTLWQLLKTYRVPTFIFVNKMDLPSAGEEGIAAELQKKLDPTCFAMFTNESLHARNERLAVYSESFLESFLESGNIDDYAVSELIAERKLFPCFFGAALHLAGVEEFINRFALWTLDPAYGDSFGAKVYKISRNFSGGAQGGGNRITFMKMVGGSLSVRDEIRYVREDGTPVTEKVSQIRLYSGDKFEQVDTVYSGDICGVIGLSGTYAGQGLGDEPDASRPVLEPVLTYKLILPDGCDERLFYPKLKQLEEEEPALHLVWKEELREIHAQLMGEVQIDILKRLIKERFDIEVSVGTGNILYKETLTEPVVGIGHFEPLRHYAEVHLLLEPLPQGSGRVYDTQCSEDVLERNWQRLVLSHLSEKEHKGVLMGAPLTDVKITLLTGKAHKKHTEGGDFREATWRAVRQGLMMGKSQLLEPFYKYRMELPAEYTGRAINDLQMRNAEFKIENSDGELTVIVGRVPVSEMRDYFTELNAYTKGFGRLFCTFDGYFPCHDTESVLETVTYFPEADIENPPHSVFCEHGAGFVVPWDEVPKYKHLESGYGKQPRNDSESLLAAPKTIARNYHIDDKELEAIMLREFGPIKRRQYSDAKVITADEQKKLKEKKQILILDGYNLIFQWDFLKKTAEDNLEVARDILMDIVGNYVSYTKADVTLVFDAYLVKGGKGSDYERDGYKVVYTQQDETADTYIERLCHQLGPNFNVRVVTSDRLIRLSAIHAGVFKMSAEEFEDEIRRMNTEITEYIKKISAKDIGFGRIGDSV